MNTDERVVAGFGDEWQRFDQSVVSERETIISIVTQNRE